jgi:hypothetical protein
MQQLTGTLSFYDENNLSYLDAISASNEITVNINNGDFSFNLTVIFNPQVQSALVGPIIRTLSFVGVDYNILVT